MNYIIENFLNFLITPFIRWIMYFLMIIILLYSYQIEITRYSKEIGFTGLNMNWQMYVLSMIGVFGSFITFMGLWLTIPFSDSLPKYWYIPIFILMIAYYTQITIDTKPISTDDEGTENFTSPPKNVLPQKYRLLIHYIILIVDIIVFVQFYIYFGVFDYSKNTYLHRYLLERFGGWYDGHKLAYLTEWLGLAYVLNDFYYIFISKTFEACEYKLPLSWNF
jgi:hypothetical protein